jgi:hypothetical protein
MIWTDLLFNFPEGKIKCSCCLSCYSVGFASSLSGGEKRPGRGADRSPSTCFEFENDWRYTSTPPIFLHVERDVNLPSPLHIKCRSVECCARWQGKLPPRCKKSLWICKVIPAPLIIVQKPSTYMAYCFKEMFSFGFVNRTNACSVGLSRNEWMECADLTLTAVISVNTELDCMCIWQWSILKFLIILSV